MYICKYKMKFQINSVSLSGMSIGHKICLDNFCENTNL